eukprot:355503-Amphidinium_carterae.1
MQSGFCPYMEEYLENASHKCNRNDMIANYLRRTSCSYVTQVELIDQSFNKLYSKVERLSLVVS